MPDIRQTKNWSDYISSLGWTSVNIDGIYVYSKKLFGFALVKVQRPQNLTKESVKKIEDWAIKQNALFLKFDLDNPEHEKLLKEESFENSTSPLLCTSTIIIDLTKSVNELWKNLKKDARYSISYAKKRGLVTTFFRNPTEEELVSFHARLLKAGRQKSIYVQPLYDHKLKLKAFGENLILAQTFQGETLLSSSIALVNGDSAFLEHFFSTKHGRSLHSTYFELWGHMVYLKEIGVKRFDFEGIYDDRFPVSTKNWLGFTYFKKKFGGEIVEHPKPKIKYYNKILLRLKKFAGPLPL